MKYGVGYKLCACSSVGVGKIIATRPEIVISIILTLEDLNISVEHILVIVKIYQGCSVMQCIKM